MNGKAMAEICRDKAFERAMKPRIRVGYGNHSPSRVIKGWGGNRTMLDAAILSCWLELLNKNKPL